MEKIGSGALNVALSDGLRMLCFAAARSKGMVVVVVVWCCEEWRSIDRVHATRDEGSICRKGNHGGTMGNGGYAGKPGDVQV